MANNVLTKGMIALQGSLAYEQINFAVGTYAFDKSGYALANFQRPKRITAKD